MPCEVMKYSLKHLKKKKSILIIGDDVSGKTSFCLEVMTTFLKKCPDLTPLILTESSQWGKIKFDKKYIIFIDNIVGKSNFIAGEFESWSRVFDSMLSRLDSVFIIIALKRSIWKLKKDGFNDFELFKANNPVDLTKSGKKSLMLNSPKPKVGLSFSEGDKSVRRRRGRHRDLGRGCLRFSHFLCFAFCVGTK